MTELVKTEGGCGVSRHSPLAPQPGFQQSVMTGSAEASTSIPSVDTVRKMTCQMDNNTVEGQCARRASFMDMFCANVRRTFRQSVRRRFEVILEVIVPLFFIAVTIILWATWGTVHKGESPLIDYRVLPQTVDPEYYKLFVCSFNLGDVPGLSACRQQYDLECFDENFTAPFKGVCVYKNVNPGYLLLVLANSFIGRIAPVPPLDAVIVYQWLARHVNARVILPGGLLPNNRLSAIRSSGLLYFVGDAAVMEGVTQHLEKRSNYFRNVYGGIFHTMEDAERAVQNNARNWGIVHIRRFEPGNLDVKIYLNSTTLPSLHETVSSAYPGGFQPDGAELYALSGYLTLQREISDHHLEVFFPGSGGIISPYMMPQGFVDYTESPLLKTARGILPALFSLAFLFTVTSRVHQNVLEKESKIRETILIMGMRKLVLNTVWFLKPALIDIVVCTIATAMLKLSYMPRSDPVSLFIVFFTFTLTTIPLSGLISCFFSKTRLALLVSPIAYFVMTLPYAVECPTNGVLNMFAALLSPTAFVSIIHGAMAMEVSGGFHLVRLQTDGSSVAVELMLVMLVVDFILYSALMLYVDAVLPNDWGTVKHPLFFIMDPIRAFCGARGRTSNTICHDVDGRAENGVFEDTEGTEHGAAVVMTGLRKEYRRGGNSFVAVNNFCWSMERGEISVLLGLNGAGKSTVMNMMTGMVKPDSGDCLVHGRSVRKELSEVRQQMGYCPQHNILWPELTCREHLEFFGKIKGLKGRALDRAVVRMLKETGLAAKADDLAAHLSGGQKRMLSVGIAFVGGSSVVLLDEPTAGMDASSRRQAWSLLQRMATEHTILLTTHFMDEADLLSHRIAILNEGRLQCSGSSMFLKSKLGLGYSLTVVTRSKEDFPIIDDTVKHHLAGAELLSRCGCEVMYRLPLSDVTSFPPLIEAMEAAFGGSLSAYSLAATTLEEVFLRACGGLEGATRKQRDYSSLWNRAKRHAVGLTQFKASMWKRIYTAFRDRRSHTLQVVCLVCILVETVLMSFNVTEMSSLSLSFDVYKGEVLVDSSNCGALWGADPSASNVYMNNTSASNTRELSIYGIRTWFTHKLPRYAAVSCGDEMLLDLTPGTVPVVMLYNSSAAHQPAITMSMMYQLTLQRLLGAPANVSWSVGFLEDNVTYVNALRLILMGAIMMIPLTLITSNPVAWIVRERECGSLHLQKIAGLKFPVYWACNFLFDIAMYLVSALAIVLILLTFGREDYVGSETLGAFVTALVLYGLTNTAFGYLLSFIFREHAKAQLIVMGFNFVFGFVSVIVVYVLSLLDKTRGKSDNLRWLFRLMPSFCIGESIISVSNFRYSKAVGNAVSAFDMDRTGYSFVYLAAEFPFFSLLVMLFDHPRRRAWWGGQSYNRAKVFESDREGDSDVEGERHRVCEFTGSDVCQPPVRTMSLSKQYPNGRVAVRDLFFSVSPGEVFALLGTNGAGKTTTMSILCQELVPTGGVVEIGGYDIMGQREKALQCIGYCPQFDACLSLLSVEQHLRLHAGLHGMEREETDDVVGSLVQMCDLEKYRKTLVGELSGGNRRKLCLALSLVGGPSIIFLDEPTAGMDPISRRKIWSAIERAADHCAVVLTTHHLEEVEALAHRVAIMKDGTMRCIGRNVHLKGKYGTGYEMHICVAETELPEVVITFVAGMFPGAMLREHKGKQLVYALPRSTSLAAALRTLESGKGVVGIADYSVSQATIERVFLHFTQQDELSSQEGIEMGNV